MSYVGVEMRRAAGRSLGSWLKALSVEGIKIAKYEKIRLSLRVARYSFCAYRRIFAYFIPNKREKEERTQDKRLSAAFDVKETPCGRNENDTENARSLGHSRNFRQNSR